MANFSVSSQGPEMCLCPWGKSQRSKSQMVEFLLPVTIRGSRGDDSSHLLSMVFQELCKLWIILFNLPNSLGRTIL